MQGYIQKFTWPLLIGMGALISLEPNVEVKSKTIDSSICRKEELLTFFPPMIVKEVLISHHIAENKVDVIAQELSKKQQVVIQIMEKKVSKMDPPPFEDVTQRDKALQIFKETLYEEFAAVLKSHDITDEKEIKAMLDDMQAIKGKLFVECIKSAPSKLNNKEQP